MERWCHGEDGVFVTDTDNSLSEGDVKEKWSEINEGAPEIQ